MQLTSRQEKTRELLVNLRSMHSGNAATYVLSLEDAEVAAIAAAGPQNHTDGERARRDVNDLVKRYGERREADQGRAGLPIAAAVEARNGARELLQLHCGLHADGAALQEGKLTPDQRAALAAAAKVRREALANSGTDPITVADVRAIVGAELLLPPLRPTENNATAGS